MQREIKCVSSPLGNGDLVKEIVKVKKIKNSFMADRESIGSTMEAFRRVCQDRDETESCGD